MKPLISVLIPSYNYGCFIKEAINSVLQQTFKDFEIIVVDDGSTDNTKDVVGKFPEVRYIYQDNGGVSKARNTAVRAARGKWVAFLDADDLWKEDKLQKQIEYLETHPACRIVFTRFRNFTDVPEELLNARQRETLQTEVSWYLPSALVDAELFSECGLFNESIQYSEDTDWVFRLKFLKIDMSACLEEELYLRRIHEANVTVAHPPLTEQDVSRLAFDAYRRVKKSKSYSVD